MRASVMPSEKYSCAGSAERFCRGKTASEWICEALAVDCGLTKRETVKPSTSKMTTAPKPSTVLNSRMRMDGEPAATASSTGDSATPHRARRYKNAELKRELVRHSCL